MTANGKVPTFGAAGDELAKLQSEMKDDGLWFIRCAGHAREKERHTGAGKKNLGALEAARQQRDVYRPLENLWTAPTALPT